MSQNEIPSAFGKNRSTQPEIVVRLMPGSKAGESNGIRLQEAIERACTLIADAEESAL